MVNKLLSSLAEICKDYPWQEKILIVPSYSAGHELCESLASARGGWVNLHTETTRGLANQVAGEYLAQHNITLLTSTFNTTIIEEILRKLENDEMLQYFNKRKASDGLVNAIANTVFELRAYGIASDSLNKVDFVNIHKGEDLKKILQVYEDYLVEQKYIDYPGLIKLALKIAVSVTPDEKKYILPSFLNLTPIETELIQLLAGDSLKIIDTDPLTFNEAPPPVEVDSISCFHAYGINNEVKAILRRIQQENKQLDSVTIAYTSEEYIPVIYSLSKRLGFSLTVAEGLPVSFTAPGRVLKGIIEWIKQDFLVTVLKDLLISGDVTLKCKDSKEEIPAHVAARELRKSGIGWGRDRYSILSTLSQSYLEKAKLIEDQSGRNKYQEQSEVVNKINTCMQSLLSCIPVPDDNNFVNFRELTSSLADVLVRLAKVQNKNDTDALKGLVFNITQAGQMATFEMELGEALERIENLTSGYRVGASASKPGHLHIVSYNNLIWTLRPNTYVVGLDANTFPGSGRQDPVLLDMERSRINDELPLGIKKPTENQYTLAAALASRRGKIVLSYSSFNVVENREVYPSFILLQVYRLLKNDSTLDYSDLINYLGKPEAFCPQDSKPTLDETEWWISKALTQPIVNGRDMVKQCYQSINQGSVAAEARNNAEPTEFDGLVPINAGELDPRKNKKIVMSSSEIEYLASCPYAYFLRYVLKMYPVEEVTYDPSCWLDALSRGLLLHEIYDKFMKQVSEKKEKVEANLHRDMIFEIADELIGEYKELIPPPNDVVFDYEVRDVYSCCEIFLTEEESQKDITPAFFELPFGFGSDAVKKSGGVGLENPIEIKLEDQTSFKLRGRIDRVDENSDGTYAVWDYKTGSTYGYDDNKFLHKGRQIQHALYAFAVEEIIKSKTSKKDIKVKSSGYYFPTAKGEGQRIPKDQSDQVKVIEALNCLFDILGTGSFIATNDDEKCNICDYTEICNNHIAVGRAKELVASGCSSLNPWRRLMDIG
ncbi:MAG: hypothetical protein FH758_08165 [Firmicutes bacterium]|nr:hypothetical protein [Bacillota bacterium]